MPDSTDRDRDTEGFTPQQREIQDVIQKQIGDEVLVMKWALVVEFNNGDIRTLGKMSSPDITYWDWFGMLAAAEKDLAVDWTGILTEDDFTSDDEGEI